MENAGKLVEREKAKEMEGRRRERFCIGLRFIAVSGGTAHLNLGPGSFLKTLALRGCALNSCCFIKSSSKGKSARKLMQR